MSFIVYCLKELLRYCAKDLIYRICSTYFSETTGSDWEARLPGGKRCKTGGIKDIFKRLSYILSNHVLYL